MAESRDSRAEREILNKFTMSECAQWPCIMGALNSILLENVIASLVSTSSRSFTESSTPDGGDSCQPLGHGRRLLRARESAVRESQETRTAKGGAGQHQ